ncbi:G kinase-anchoring protein 1-like [Actinia tenebrosa]|uniref:G kinase-anchoring protein 1-like n=1 Tax=Actinia tenebrosa TaxID=6105 RepID=A0A6P8IKL5_ACTTE|nr:G kinase-anchoring protein 1-like [Actinia tenebrosa]
MAKKANPLTDLPTACRFAVLKISDDSEEEETKPFDKKGAKNTSSSNTVSSGGAAKKKRNKKKRHNRSKNSQGNDIDTVASSDSMQVTKNDEENGWEVWQNKDEQFVMDQFQKDLQAALEESKSVIGPSPSQQAGNDLSSNKKKKKEKTISLDEFISGNLDDDTRNPVEANGNLSAFTEDLPSSMFGLDDFQMQDSHSTSVTFVTSVSNEKLPKSKSKKKTHDKTEDVESGSKSEAKKIIPATQEESMKAEMVHVQEELSKKDETVTKLQKTIEKQKIWISDLQKELIQVKKRNKQLCHILAQGEMKEKADLLMQIEELNEFREQVVELHAELEQERSKSSALRQEMIKHQGSHSRARHSSTS